MTDNNVEAASAAPATGAESQPGMEKARTEARKAEKIAWIAAHGSDGLKVRIGRGYPCSRQYIEERLAIELPGWIACKFDGLPEWTLKNRSYPSDAALQAEDAAKAAGFAARTFWAEWPEGTDEDESFYEGDDAEVVVISDYHGYEVYLKTSY